MKILVISQFYPPEMGAPAARFSDFARHWLAAGHSLTVITAFPNFPSGIIPEGYRGKWYQREEMHGVQVHRGYIFTHPKLNAVVKGLGYLTYIISACCIVAFRRIECDVVISTSPPPTAGVPGLLAKHLFRKPLIFDVRDIWPEGIVQSGRIKNKFVIKALQWIEMTLYRSASLVTVVTPGKKERLIERGVPAEKIGVVSNGVDIVLFDQEASAALPDDLAGLATENLCLTYAGVFNPPQGLDIILDCAARLKREAPELYARVAFVLIGDGSLRGKLEERKAAEGLDRVHFMGIRPRTVVFAMLRASFANLVTLRKRRDTHTVPSKIYEALASSRPTLLSTEGEPADILTRARGGLTSAPGDVSGLLNNMMTLLRNPEQARQLGASGREYCEHHFDRKATARQFIEAMEALVDADPTHAARDTPGSLTPGEEGAS